MAKFLKGNELNSEIEKLFDEANVTLILISPFIKLHDRYVSALKAKQNNPDLVIKIVFGKNEDDISKSMKLEDFNFFKEFPNIQIGYEKNLHAKYYANENGAIITSMNLYSFSQNNNIEAGIQLLKQSLLGTITNNSDNTLEKEAWQYFDRVIEQSDLLFKKTPQFTSGMLGLSKKYTSSIVEKDILTDFFLNKKKTASATNIISKNTLQLGYCIRTGERIPFNPSSPLNNVSYQSWQKFNNKDYPEKYCHFSGEQSNGETTFSKPILKKNWKKAKETFNI